MVSNACALEYIQTENEYEALLLENNLIKKYKPKYNINLKDGKTYPVLKLTGEEFPRFYRTRNIKNDGARYFGPFPNVQAVIMFLDLINRNYKLRQSEDAMLHAAKRSIRRPTMQISKKFVCFWTGTRKKQSVS